MAKQPSGRGGPSPRADATRRGRGWEDEAPAPRNRRPAEPEPWLDEGEYEEDEARVHTLIGRRMLFGLLFLLGVLTIGVVVGILLVSKRESAPIDVPGVGEAVPVLTSPGPWKVPPSGPDVDGVPVEGQGQVLFGTGDGRETEARIALDSLPEDPLPRPVGEIVEEGVPVSNEIPLEAPPVVEPAPVPAPPPARPKASDTVVPKEAPVKKPVTPKVIYPPEPAEKPASGGGGQVLQLGAFSSEARARTAFKELSGRYAYLSGMEPHIVPVASDGKTLYRLRATAASPADARNICGRLKVAGEACSVVN
ncbi:SPOR domain-containing protein [Sandaracinobacter sp. RS1-74]|uniref:SPOR domain-containing protein n=1 Tax=Sandaracinobacteroides sayramensis TaxID=2913411 RepID=UPI001EDAC9D9|nr:SPOR domain-containing protein [Sandaracinobacteroides sayramensis]MCG2840251.1 SPOR domain-containing protein [Sandaracinobacteroides sayramensis]